MMKKFLLMAACVLALSACKKEGSDEPTPAGGSIVGAWELSSVATKATVGDVQVNVYVEFGEDNSFTLYQKVGEGRYTKFDGTYTLATDGKLSGSYSGGSAWGPYDVTLNGDSLTLASSNGKEVDTYKKISAIPEIVTNNIY